MLPPERRLGRVMQLIDERKFFTLQSGRQTGKTTSARWLARHYNEGDRYRANWVDIQCAREEPDPGAAFLTVIEALDRAVLTWLGDVGVPGASARSPQEQGGEARARAPRLIVAPEPAILSLFRAILSLSRAILSPLGPILSLFRAILSPLGPLRIRSGGPR